MKISEAPEIFNIAFETNDAPLLSSLHGIGKSTVVRDWARDNNVYNKTLILSLLDTSDLVGLPNKNGNSTDWLEPIWLTDLHSAVFPQEVKIEDLEFNDTEFEKAFKKHFKDFKEEKIKKSSIEVFYKDYYDIRNSNNNVLTLGQDNILYKNRKRTSLFLDELNRSSLDIRQASLQLILEKELYNHRLPKVDGYETLIISAINPDSGEYSVEELDPALRDRLLSLDIEPDVESWVQWARENDIHEGIIKFIIENNEFLHFTPDESTGDEVGATPRSWAKLSKYVEKMDIDSPLFPTVVKGKIGSTLALRFIKFLDTFKDSITLEDVVKKANESYKSLKNIEKVGEELKDFLKDIDVSVKSDFAKNLLKNANSEKEEDIIPLMGVLYSLELELFAGVLKPVKENDVELYKKIVKIDKEMNNTQLFYRYAKNINN